MKTPGVTKWIALLCLARIALAQDQPVFRVNTRLVEVDVVVRDNAGPVANLTRNDFTILDNGKPQKIAAFNLRSANSAGNSSRLPAGAVSNRLISNGEEPVGATVVLWDALNTETQDQSYVRDQVLKYLRTLKQGQPVALLTLVKNLRVIRDFTDDPYRLIQALSKEGPQQSVNLSAGDLGDLASQINNPLLATPSGGTALADAQTMAENAAAEMSDYALRDRVYITAASLETIAHYLGGLHGRKKLVWVSGSFPSITQNQRSRVGNTQIETQDFGPQIDLAVRKLNDANVAVYPLDPRGLTPDGVMASGIDTMRLLADRTGGKAVYASNGLTEAMDAVMQDDRIVYALGFYPTDEKPDGTLHKISVKVARKGVEIRHRKGYLASDTKVANDVQRRSSLNEAMQSPLDSTGIGLTAVASPVQNRPGIYKLELTVDLSDLHLEHKQDRWVSSLSFATHLSPSDSTKGSLETVNLSLTEDRLRAALNGGYVFRREVDLGGLAGELRVVVEDRATGAVGSVRVPFRKTNQ